MNTKTYKGKTSKEVISRITRELGPDADIVDRKLLKGKDGSTHVEVIAAPRLPGMATQEHTPGLLRSILKYPAFLAAIGGLIAVIVLLIIAVIIFREGKEAAPFHPVEPGAVSIAVLAFADLSPEGDQEYFCDGVAEEIINKLARVKDLKVISRASSFYFKGKDVDIGEIGRQLGVSAILDGSVRKSGNKLRVSAQLIDVSDKSNIWSDSFDRELQDIFAIQEEVALAVVDSLKLQLGVEEKRRLQESHETSPEVYELYLQGRFARSPKTLERLEMAIGLFDRAIDKDPSFAPAYAMKAICYLFLTTQFASKYSYISTSQKARVAIDKAEELSPELADVHLALARFKYICEWDWRAAEHKYKRALELAPGRGDIHASYGDYLQTMGRFDEGIVELDKALELDPFSVNTRTDILEAYHNSGRYEEAVRQYEKINELAPNFFIANMYGAFCYAKLGQTENALALLNKLEAIAGPWERPMLICAQAGVYAFLRRDEESRRHLTQLLEIMKTRYWYPSLVGAVYAVLGDNDSALAWLEKAYEEHDPHLIIQANVGNWWNNLYSDPRFDEFIKKTGLPFKRHNH